MTNHKSTKFRALTIMNCFEGQPFLKRWIDNHDGSEDVAEDEKTPCGTLTDTEASMVNSCAHYCWFTQYNILQEHLLLNRLVSKRF